MANDPYISSIRLKAIQTLRGICEQVHDARYYVRRGPVNWAQFDFDKHPFAMSLLVDEATFLRPTNTMQVSIEIFMRLKSEEEMSRKNISDTGIDGLAKDIEWIVAELEQSAMSPLQAMQSGGKDGIVLGINKESDKLIELSDLDQGLQGLWATFEVFF